jgi:hypothetical protein
VRTIDGFSTSRYELSRCFYNHTQSPDDSGKPPSAILDLRFVSRFVWLAVAVVVPGRVRLFSPALA